MRGKQREKKESNHPEEESKITEEDFTCCLKDKLRKHSHWS